MSHLYFAYGSNMASATIAERTAGATFAGKALLRDHRLAFTLPSLRWTGHAADILRASGAEVWGVLWLLDDPDALDKFEERYDRIEVNVDRFGTQDETGTPTQAFTYSVKPMHRTADEAPPAMAYLDRMIEGGNQAGLPTAYIDFLRDSLKPSHRA